MSASRQDAIPIYTIGYGSRTVDEFVSVLQQYRIQFLVDIRTAPYSRYKPEFSKDALEDALRAAGIRYVFMGDLLGGRPADPGCYDSEDRVDYEKVKSKAFYRTGIERIVTAFEKRQPIVLMCSEGKPEQCHRSKLIGTSLDDAEIPVRHIDEDGRTKSQAHVMAIVNPQPSLFEDFETQTSRKRYAPTEQPQHESDGL